MAILNRLRGQFDRTAAAVLTLAGAVCLIVGWIGASGTGLTAKQIPYVISGGLGGIFLMGVGAALWLSADLRDEWVKLDRIEHVLSNGLAGLGLGRDREGYVALAPLAPEQGTEKQVEVGAGASNGRHSSHALTGGGSES